MNGQNVGARLAKTFDIADRAVDHEMHIQRQVRHAPQRLDHRKAHGEIRNKVSVHNINMDVVGTGGSQSADVALQVAEIGGKDGRGYFNHHAEPPEKIVVSCTRQGRNGISMNIRQCGEGSCLPRGTAAPFQIGNCMQPVCSSHKEYYNRIKFSVNAIRNFVSPCISSEAVIN